jgi:hypothetical protein
MSTIFTFIEHPRIATRKKEGPVKVADQLPQGGAVNRFNCRFALLVTGAVGTMWCAYVFSIIALISLPSAISSGSTIVIISWIAQTFLQLVLLSIIIVGQNVQSAAADKRSEATYLDADAVLHTALQIQSHLEAQDQAIENILAAVAKMKSA